MSGGAASPRVPGITHVTCGPGVPARAAPGLFRNRDDVKVTPFFLLPGAASLAGGYWELTIARSR